MALFPEKSPAINPGSSWFYDVQHDNLLSGQRPFTEITVQNFSNINVDFYINGDFQGTVTGFNFQRFSMPNAMQIDSFSLTNTGGITINANKILVTLANKGSSIQISGMGYQVTSDIDKTLSVNETAQPFMSANDPLRYASYAEIMVSSIGALTPGSQKIYHGSNLAKQLLNLASYYSYDKREGQLYDLNQLQVNCDNPFGNMLNDPASSGNITGYTGWATDSQFTIAYDSASLGIGACKLTQTNANTYAAIQYLNFAGGSNNRIYTISFQVVSEYATTMQISIKSHTTAYSYVNDSLPAASWARYYKTYTFTTVNTETLDLTIELGGAPIGARLWTFYDQAKKYLLNSEMPQVIISGGS